MASFTHPNELLNSFARYENPLTDIIQKIGKKLIKYRERPSVNKITVMQKKTVKRKNKSNPHLNLSLPNPVKQDISIPVQSPKKTTIHSPFAAYRYCG